MAAVPRKWGRLSFLRHQDCFRKAVHPPTRKDLKTRKARAYRADWVNRKGWADWVNPKEKANRRASMAWASRFRAWETDRQPASRPGILQ